MITALVAVDDNIDSRMVVFTLEGEPEVKLANWNQLRLGSVELILTSDFAAFLNGIFSAGNFTEGAVGEIETKLNLRLDMYDEDDDEFESEKSNGKSKDKDKDEKDDEDEINEEEEEDEEDEEEEEEGPVS